MKNDNKKETKMQYLVDWKNCCRVAALLYACLSPQDTYGWSCACKGRASEGDGVGCLFAAGTRINTWARTPWGCLQYIRSQSTFPCNVLIDIPVNSCCCWDNGECWTGTGRKCDPANYNSATTSGQKGVYTNNSETKNQTNSVQTVPPPLPIETEKYPYKPGTEKDIFSTRPPETPPKP